MRFARKALLIIGTFLLVAAGVPEPSGYRMDNYNAPVPTTLTGGTVVDVAGLRSLIQRGGVVLIDVLVAPRKPEGMQPGMPWLPPPHQDIPGSIWLPGVGFGALSPQMDLWFRHQLANLAIGNKARTVVFYCKPDCWMSWNAAKRAISYGYSNVVWFPGGTDAWTAAGYRLATVKPNLPPE